MTTENDVATAPRVSGSAKAVHSPRTTSGSTLRLLDGDAYAAIIETASGREVGDRRVPGRIWIAFSAPNHVDFLFHAEDTAEPFASEFTITERAHAVCAIHLDDEVIAHLGAPTFLHKRDVYRVTWESAFDLMA